MEGAPAGGYQPYPNFWPEVSITWKVAPVCRLMVKHLVMGLPGMICVLAQVLCHTARCQHTTIAWDPAGREMLGTWILVPCRADLNDRSAPPGWLDRHEACMQGPLHSYRQRCQRQQH